MELIQPPKRLKDAKADAVLTVLGCGQRKRLRGRYVGGQLQTSTWALQFVPEKFGTVT